MRPSPGILLGTTYANIAVHLVRGGADVRHIQTFLGHASINTTKACLRMVPGLLAEEYLKAMPEIAVRLAGEEPVATVPQP